MKAFILENDRYQMNWVEGNTEWGTVKCRLPLEVSVKSERKGDIVREEYSFTNHTDKHILRGLRISVFMLPLMTIMKGRGYV